jgi:hypothetical protein
MWGDREAFDFQIFSTPAALDAAIRQRINEGNSARMTAGFCWEWSDPNPDGTLVDDITIGDFRRPWNAKPGRGRLATGIPRAPLWAYSAEGVNQVGCIYTAQGFEFDYVGVIFGTDLVYDFDRMEWVGRRENSCDPDVRRAGDSFVNLVKSAYRVLMTRGMKGCYVCFLDKDTERYVRSRIERPSAP